MTPATNDPTRAGLSLSPCPFCGRPVEIDDPDAHKRGVGYAVECEPCYLRMWAFRDEKPASLARRWNQRLMPMPRLL